MFNVLIGATAAQQAMARLQLPRLVKLNGTSSKCLVPQDIGC